MQPVTTTLPAWYVPTVCRFLSGVAGARLETRLVVVAVPCGLSTPPPLTHTHTQDMHAHTHERAQEGTTTPVLRSAVSRPPFLSRDGGGGGGGGVMQWYNGRYRYTQYEKYSRLVMD